MDEEKKKIDINSFFDKTEEVGGVAGKALEQSKLNANTIQANKTLINSLSVTIEAMKTEIRDIANYIVLENKLEKDKKDDEKFEAQDEKQKKEARDRAIALGQPIPKQAKKTASDPEKSKTVDSVGGGIGGFLGGLLKAIAVGGIIALAAPLIPVIAPMLLTAMAVGIGAIALGIVGKEIIKLLPAIGKKIREGYDASVKFAQETAAKLGAKFNELKDSVGNFLSEKKDQILDFAGDTIDATKTKIGEVTDLVVNVKDKAVTKGTELLDGAKKKVKNIGGFVKDKFNIAKNFATETKNNVVDAVTGTTDTVVDAVTGTADTVVDATIDAKDKVTEAVTEGRKGIFNMVKNISSSVREKALSTVAGAADFVTGGEFDFDNKGSSETDNISLLGKVIDAVTPKNDNSSIAPANSANTSQAIIRPTTTTIPFIKTVKNQYLSTNPNTNKLPPEIARMIQ
tara:strand:+ start:1862 stop:3229 length:1368 start_codon:yes stop_codon:yes gene_type:complete